MVKGRLNLLFMISWIEMIRTPESFISWIKLQIWELGSLQLGELWLMKSEGKFAFETKCERETC